MSCSHTIGEYCSKCRGTGMTDDESIWTDEMIDGLRNMALRDGREEERLAILKWIDESEWDTVEDAEAADEIATAIRAGLHRAH